MKILIGPSSFGERNSAPIKRLEEVGLQVVSNPYGRKLNTPELLSLLPGVVGLVAGLETLNREVMTASMLKVISRCGSGISNVDLAAAKDRGIVVRSTPLAPVVSVAELTVGCLLNLLRSIGSMNAAMHDRSWSKQLGRQLSGMKVAIIGYGNIGRHVGRLLSSLGAIIIAVDPYFKGDNEDALLMPLEEAITVADVFIIHSSGEHCIIGEPEIERMREGVYILNGARGGLVDEDALLQGLNSGKIAGAWVDTFVEEPYSGLLCNHAKVILTPHVGSYTEECRLEMEMEAVENLITELQAQSILSNA